VPTDRPDAPSTPLSAWRETILVVTGFTVVFGWMYLRPILDWSCLAESDLYEYYLPICMDHGAAAA
jgi:hypothetical protein